MSWSLSRARWRGGSCQTTSGATAQAGGGSGSPTRFHLDGAARTSGSSPRRRWPRAELTSQPSGGWQTNESVASYQAPGLTSWPKQSRAAARVWPLRAISAPDRVAVDGGELCGSQVPRCLGVRGIATADRRPLELLGGDGDDRVIGSKAFAAADLNDLAAVDDREGPDSFGPVAAE